MPKGRAQSVTTESSGDWAELCFIFEDKWEVQILKAYTSSNQHGIKKKSTYSQVVMVHIFNPSIWETEIVKSGVRGQPGLQSKSQDSQGYTEKPRLKKQQKYQLVHWAWCLTPAILAPEKVRQEN